MLCVLVFCVCVCVSYVPVVCVYVCICVYRTNWLFFFCISSLLLCFSIFIFGFKVSSCKYFTALPSILLSWHGLSLCLVKLFLLNFILVLLRSFFHLFGFLLFVWTLFLRISFVFVLASLTYTITAFTALCYHFLLLFMKWLKWWWGCIFIVLFASFFSSSKTVGLCVGVCVCL